MAKGDVEVKRVDTTFDELDRQHQDGSRRAYDLFRKGGAIADQNGALPIAGKSGQREEADVGRVIGEYTDAKRRLDALVTEAGELGERFARLAHGLSAHPTRMIIGLPERATVDATEWDIVASHPLPRIEDLVALTDDIRATALHADDLRQRLILMGCADLVEEPDGFFQ